MSSVVSNPRAEAGPDFRSWAFVALWIFAAAVVFLRSYYAFVLPALWVDDGVALFSHFRNHPSASEILHSYHGYVSVLPNLVGWLAAKFPPTLSARLLIVYALAASSLAPVFFALPRFRCILPSDRSRIFLCVILVSLPLGNFRLASLAMFSLWNLLLIVALALLAPSPQRRLRFLLEMALLMLAVCSHPLSIVLLPLCLLRCVRSRGRNSQLAGGILAATILFYFFNGIDASGASASSALRSLGLAPVLIAHRVIFESFFGNNMREGIQAAGNAWFMQAVAGFVVAALSIWLWRTRRNWMELRTALLQTSYLILAISFLVILGRDIDPRIDPGSWGQRYSIVPQYIFLLSLGVLAVRTIPQPRTKAGWSTAAALLVGIGAVVLLNVQNTRYFRSSPHEGKRVAAFLAELQADGPHPSRPHVLSRGCWSIRIEPVSVRPDER